MHAFSHLADWRAVITPEQQRVRGLSDADALRQSVQGKDAQALMAAWQRVQGTGDEARFVADTLAALRECSLIDTELGAGVHRIIANQPSLLQQIEDLQAQGWRFVRGPAGCGNVCVRETKTITLDETISDEYAAQALGHEVGHAIKHHVPDYSSKENFIRGELIDEAFAIMNQIRTHRERVANGGPDIRFWEQNQAQYHAVYDQYVLDNDFDAALAAIAAIYGREIPSNQPDATYAEQAARWYDER